MASRERPAASYPPIRASSLRWVTVASSTVTGINEAPALLKWRTYSHPGVSRRAREISASENPLLNLIPLSGVPRAILAVLLPEPRGPGGGHGHQDDGREGAEVQLLPEDDEAYEGGNGGLEAHEHPEDAGGQLAEGFELEREGDRRRQHSYPEARKEQPRVQQREAPAGDPDRREHHGADAQRDDEPRPAWEHAPGAGAQEYVGGPEAPGQQRQRDADGVKVYLTEDVERREEQDAGRREHSPEQVQQASGARDRHAQRPHELERDGYAQRYTVEGQIQREVHRREHEPEHAGREVVTAGVASHGRAPEDEQRERREPDAQEHGARRAELGEQAFCDGGAELDDPYG